MPSLTPGANQPQHDLVYTPDELAREIIFRFSSQLQQGQKVLEPCYGKGAFYKAFPDWTTNYWCEIEAGLDFLNFDSKVDWIITNPPWSKFKEFLSHSCDIANDIIFLCTINHFMTKARMRILKEKGFHIYEIHGVKTPGKPWPLSGFQLAAIHLRRNRPWGGDQKTIWSGEFGC